MRTLFQDIRPLLYIHRLKVGEAMIYNDKGQMTDALGSITQAHSRQFFNFRQQFWYCEMMKSVILLGSQNTSS